MPSSPRREVFEPDVVGIYHCYNRCSQRAFLCGYDPLTQTDFSHRKEWIRNGLKSLAATMAVDVFDYAVMDNHFHVVLRNRPDLVAGWSDEEVARRWWLTCPQRRDEAVSRIVPLGSSLLGGAAMWMLDKSLPHLHVGFPMEEAEGPKTDWRRAVLLVSAITLHNIPEGLAVGVAFGGVIAGMPELGVEYRCRDRPFHRDRDSEFPRGNRRGHALTRRGNGPTEEFLVQTSRAYPASLFAFGALCKICQMTTNRC